MSTTTTTMQFAVFPPEAIIEITDTMRGFRKLGVVAPSGLAYYDLLGDPSGDTAFPIYEAMQPQDVGDPTSWAFELVDTDPQAAQQYQELNGRLLDAGIDTLTYYRALKWARDSGRYDDLDAALAAGREATELVRESRQYLDGLVASAAVVA